MRLAVFRPHPAPMRLFVKRPCPGGICMRQDKRRLECRAMSPEMIDHTAHVLVGQGLILWVFFTSSLNYFMYKDIRGKQNKKDD